MKLPLGRKWKVGDTLALGQMGVDKLVAPYTKTGTHTNKIQIQAHTQIQIQGHTQIQIQRLMYTGSRTNTNTNTNLYRLTHK